MDLESHLSVGHDSLREWDKHHVWHSFTQMSEYEPLIIDRAAGCWLYDIDGRRIFDGVSNLWCNVHGHNHPHINRAVREQLEKVAHVTSLGMSNPTTIQLAKRLVDETADGLNHVFFSSDGASAVEVALKMAFQYWHQADPPQPSRNRFVALGNAYHGDTIGSVSVGGIEHFHSKFDPLLFKAIRVDSPNVYRGPASLDEDRATEFFAQRYRKIIEQHHQQIAAFIVEPLVQGAAGMVVHPPGLLAAIRDMTREFGILMIADEVAVGFGRTGTLFACDVESVCPDILCLGKGLSGGYLPISATLASTEIWNAFLGKHQEAKTLFHGHTFGGNPLCAAAALASLELFESEQTLQSLAPKIAHFSQRVRELGSHSNVGDVRTIGMLAGIELVRDKSTKTAFDWTEHRGRNICRHALEKDVWLRPLGDVIVAMPPFCCELEEIDLLVDAINYGIEKEFGD